MKVTKKKAAKFWEECRNLELTGYELIAVNGKRKKRVSTFQYATKKEFRPHTIKLPITKQFIDRLTAVMPKAQTLTAQEGIQHSLEKCWTRVTNNVYCKLNRFSLPEDEIIYRIKLHITETTKDYLKMLQAYWNLSTPQETIYYAVQIEFSKL